MVFSYLAHCAKHVRFASSCISLHSNDAVFSGQDEGRSLGLILRQLMLHDSLLDRLNGRYRSGPALPAPHRGNRLALRHHCLGCGVSAVLNAQKHASLFCLREAFHYFRECRLASPILERMADDISVHNHALSLGQMCDCPRDCFTRKLGGELMCGGLLDQSTEVNSLRCGPLFPILVELVSLDRSFARTRV